MWRLIAIICLVIICSGCMGPDDGDGKSTVAGDDGGDADEGADEGPDSPPLDVAITSPRAGNILSGDEEVGFDADVTGGEAPYDYTWTSNINGPISRDESFDISPSDLSAGTHTIILKVTDASGEEVRASVIVYKV